MNLWVHKGGLVKKKARQKVESLQPEEVRKVAVIRHAALGDMVITRPFLVELRKYFPNAEITLSLVTNYTYGAPEDLVDRLHVIDGNDRRNVPLREQYKKVKGLGEQDIVFDLAATSRSYWLCALNKANLKVGFPYDWYRHYLFYDISIFRTDFKFEGELMLEMLNMFGFRTDLPLNFALPVAKSEEGTPYIVYFTGASTPFKRWPGDSFSELIGRMAERYPGSEHVVLEGIGPQESVDEMMESLGKHKNVRSVKAMPFQETIDFIGNAALLVSNDTGIRNLAIATETPTVGIFFWPVAFRYWPRGGIHEVVFHHDLRVPTVDEVFDCTAKHIDKAVHI